MKLSLVMLVVGSQMAFAAQAMDPFEALHRIDLRWGRPRLGMPTKVDPEKAQKQWAIAKAAVGAPAEAAIVYADESRIQLLPLIRAMKSAPIGWD